MPHAHPAVEAMKRAMGELEGFLPDRRPLPPLIKCGLVHSQFETVHPFLDGNGRMGRLLNTFLLCQQGILERPLLYLSYFFNRNRLEYYDRLHAVRDSGDWESWMRFFLRGVVEVATRLGDRRARHFGIARGSHRPNCCRQDFARQIAFAYLIACTTDRSHPSRMSPTIWA
jgi:cell filamentation protein, protein adenylyltransferase